jgi:hypothetical protein
MAKLSLVPETLDLEFYRNDKSAWEVLITDEGLAAIDLTGAMPRLQVREQPTSSSAVLTLTDGAGLVITPFLGKIELALSALNWAALTSSFYYYDLEILYNGDALPITELRGTITIIGDVSR